MELCLCLPAAGLRQPYHISRTIGSSVKRSQDHALAAQSDWRLLLHFFFFACREGVDDHRRFLSGQRFRGDLFSQLLRGTGLNNIMEGSLPLIDIIQCPVVPDQLPVSDRVGSIGCGMNHGALHTALHKTDAIGAVIDKCHRHIFLKIKKTIPALADFLEAVFFMLLYPESGLAKGLSLRQNRGELQFQEGTLFQPFHLCLQIHSGSVFREAVAESRSGSSVAEDCLHNRADFSVLNDPKTLQIFS